MSSSSSRGANISLFLISSASLIGGGRVFCVDVEYLPAKVLHGDAPLHTATLVVGPFAPGLNSDKGSVASPTVDDVSSLFALSSK